MKKSPASPIDTEPPAEFKNLGDLVAIIADGEARVTELSKEVDDIIREAVDERRKEFTELQAAIQSAKEGAEAICTSHRNWFGGKKSLELLHGTCAFKASKSLEVANERATIALIRAEETPENASKLIRVVEEVDKEALESLSDEELAKFGLHRLEKESFSVKPRKIDLAKVAATEPKKATKAKAA